MKNKDLLSKIVSYIPECYLNTKQKIYFDDMRGVIEYIQKNYDMDRKINWWLFYDQYGILSSYEAEKLLLQHTNDDSDTPLCSSWLMYMNKAYRNHQYMVHSTKFNIVEEGSCYIFKGKKFDSLDKARNARYYYALGMKENCQSVSEDIPF